jgi:undecaprenyl diphosphate synthase
MNASPRKKRRSWKSNFPEGRLLMKKDSDTQIVMPRHIGIIMDGNGRWAKKRFLPRSAGHKVGASVFRTITKYAARIGVEYLTVYAFSTENWSRPQEEVGALMVLFKQYLEEALHDFLNENIQVRFLGDVTRFPLELQDLIHQVEKVSQDKTGMVLNLAMNYGGRAEIVHGVQALAQKVKEGTLQPEDITEDLLSSQLYTAGEPDPDLIIRPSGEERLSNFLLWQSAYAEFVYFDILWPDFKEKDLDEAIRIYSSRQRRFGGV